MNKLIVLAVACGAAYLLYDLQSVKLKLNETIRAGTLQGVEKCVAYSKSDLVTTDTTRNACVESFQKVLYGNDFAYGRAGPRVHSEIVTLEGSLENKTPGFVTTWVQVALILYDDAGQERKTKADTHIWLEPHSSSDFSVELPDLTPEDLKDVKFCERDDKPLKSCMDWGVVKIKGIEI